MFKSLSQKQKIKVFSIFGVILMVYGILSVFMGIYFHNDAVRDKANEQASTTNSVQSVEDTSSAYVVNVGSYVENVYDFSLDRSSYSVSMLAWFTWWGSGEDGPQTSFRIVNGKISDRQVMTEYTSFIDPANPEYIVDYVPGKGEEAVLEDYLQYYDDVPEEYADNPIAFITDNTQNYARVRFFATINKVFDTTRAGIDSHRLDIRIEDSRDASIVKFEKDPNMAADLLDPNIQIPGYGIKGSSTSINTRINKTTYSEPRVDLVDSKTGTTDFTQFVTSIDIQKDVSAYLNNCVQTFMMMIMATLCLLNNILGRLRYAFVGSTIFGVMSAHTNIISKLPSGQSEINLMSIVSDVTLFGILIILGILMVTETIQKKYTDTLDKVDYYKVGESSYARAIDIMSSIALLIGYIVFNVVIVWASLSA